MTEEEAKTKWCPHARSFWWAGTERKGRPVSVNRYISEGDEPQDTPHAVPTAPHADCLCIGSGCMSWRWSHGFPLPDDPPPISGRYHGFCGLAGKP